MYLIYLLINIGFPCYFSPTTIFVFNKLTYFYKGITQKKFPAVPIWLFHANRIEKVALEDASFRVILKHWGSKWQSLFPFCCSWPGGWKTGDNRIRGHWFWSGGSRNLLHTSTRDSVKVQGELVCFFSCLFVWLFVLFLVTNRNSF